MLQHRSSPSSIPRPRITSSHFRPPPQDSQQQHGSSIPRPPTSPSPLLVSRKRPRAETVASPSPRSARQSHIPQPLSTAAGSPRAFSANFVGSNGGSTSADGDVERSWMSASAFPTQSHIQSNDEHISQDPAASNPHAAFPNPSIPNWRASLFSTAAAVANKVWDFARNNKFFGFRAGGGTAYDMHTGLPQQFEAVYTSTSLSTELADRNTQHEMRAAQSRQFSWGAPDMPGWFSPAEAPLPSQDSNMNSIWESTHSTLPLQSQEQQQDEDHPRPSKRRQTSSGGDWVLVSPEPTQSPPPAEPAKQVSQHSHIPRPSPRASGSMRRRSHFSPSASARRTSVVSTSYNTNNNGGSRRSSIMPPTSKPLRSARSLSSFSPRPQHQHQYQQDFDDDDDGGDTRKMYTTPKSGRMSAAHTLTSADVARYRAKKDREERKQDASMRKLNEQLRAMIREGKAALGTKVEVDLEGE